MKLSRDSAIRIVLFVAVMLGASLLFGVIKLPWSKANEENYTGAPTPWNIQLAVAAGEARRNSEKPVLVAVKAEPADAIPMDLLEDQAFMVTFLFVENSPKRAKLFVELNDSDPIQTLRKDGSFIPPNSTEDDLAKYSRALETVKKSPRDIYYRTSVDASATLGKSESGYLVDLTLHLFPQFEDMPENQAIWSIYYYRPESGGKPEKRVDYLINAADGTILQRVEDMKFPTASTPTAAP